MKTKPVNAGKFYDSISGIYGNMIDFDKSLKLRTKSYSEIFPLNGKALDVGCGIGVDSIALAMTGHKVFSLDISKKMIEEAKRNSAKYNLNIDFREGTVEVLSKNYFGKIDYAISVGNTIAHLTNVEFKKAILIIYKVLKPGGKIFMHILNYELFIKESRRINNISNKDGKTIIRFYDFGKKDIDFNVLSFSNDNPKDFKLSTTKQYPHFKNEINSYLKSAGFYKIKFYGSFQKKSFTVKKSKDLFIEAVKI